MKQFFSGLILIIFFSLTAVGQTNFSVNQKVEVEWKGRWYKATILSAKNNTYKIHYDNYASSWDETVTAKRIRAIGTEGKAAATAAVKYGKYGCTSSRYVNGFYEYSPKGSFVLSKNGAYAYNGFEKPSTGTFTVDAAGVISFRGGYFNGGQATPIEGQENRYYVVFPTIPDNRWTCSWISEI